MYFMCGVCIYHYILHVCLMLHVLLCIHVLLHVWGCMSVVQIYTLTALLQLAFVMVFRFTINVDHLYFCTVQQDFNLLIY